MDDSKICYLDITSFSGLSTGAVHYYGKLHCGDYAKDVELTHKLTRQEAIEYRKVEMRIHPGNPFPYAEGQVTEGFSDKDSIINLAIETYKRHFPNAEILVQGSAACAEPQRILDASEAFAPFKDRMNALYAEAESFGWWDGNEKKMLSVEKRYDELMREYKLQ